MKDEVKNVIFQVSEMIQTMTRFQRDLYADHECAESLKECIECYLGAMERISVDLKEKSFILLKKNDGI